MSVATQRKKVVAWMSRNRRRFVYTNDWRRNDPLRYNAGDCSSVINAAYASIGVPFGSLGIRSFNMAKNRNMETIAQGTNARGAQVTALLAKLEPGDIICMGWPGTVWDKESGVSHVELYAGGGKCWGHGGPGRGPNLRNVSYWLYSTSRFIVKRPLSNKTTTKPSMTQVGAGSAINQTVPGEGTPDKERFLMALTDDEQKAMYAAVMNSRNDTKRSNTILESIWRRVGAWSDDDFKKLPARVRNIQDVLTDAVTSRYPTISKILFPDSDARKEARRVRNVQDILTNFDGSYYPVLKDVIKDAVKEVMAEQAVGAAAVEEKKNDDA